MLKIERQNIIEEKLNKEGFVLVPTLSEMFRCSEETVRRDLNEMESMGKLIRTHGGAYLQEKFDKSFPTNLRKTFYKNTKHKLAQHAMGQISKNDVIMLDCSTTCLFLAEALIQSQLPLTIITNSYQICGLCNENNSNVNLICIGGELRRRTSSFTNQNTVEFLERYHADKCYISCPKITVEFGLSDNHLNEARVRETMLKQSEFKCLIADHTKFDRSSNILFKGLESIDMILTDQELDKNWENYAVQNNIKLEYCID